MTDRVAASTGEALIQKVSEAQAAMRDLKGVQLIGGDSLAFYQSDSGNQYDWTGLLPESPLDPSTGHKVLRVDAVAEQQPVLFADLIMELYVGSLDEPYTLQDYRAAVGALTTGFLIRTIPQPLDVTQPAKARFGVAITGDKVTTCYAKFYVVGNDTVTITVTELN